ncbi:DNA-binding response regulator [Candidatus Velamenicoccus archaeovorus]|uniref:DNA-binding response regulator n=1 Tax=Velamenicoccus archaeovorus TaxID=1930593 RepID=A0A410P6U6_VELA1|nr:response regulator transcription factor [Candidatus Velamenicoccus archaeovorus]QAT17870.1 DNA-binding response regulator [Candidatus Velamenicoccus archaeovorus]
MRILLVEDEIKMASFIQRGLKEEDYVVDVVNDGEKALFQAEINPYDLIILDVILPVKDGITVCRELRSKKINVPVLMLTSKDRVRDRVLGLNSGADDYLAKPFAFEELLARISALLRRNKQDKTGILKIADLEMDQLRHKVARAGKEIQLTSKEFALLEYLMLNATHVVTRTMISEHVWHEDFDSFTNVIDVYMNFLRNKIDKGQKKQLIHTIHGKGYVLKE